MRRTEHNYAWQRNNSVVEVRTPSGDTVRLTLQDLYYMRKCLIRWTPKRVTAKSTLSGAQKSLLAELRDGAVLREGPDGGYELVQPGRFKRTANTGSVRAMLKKGILVFKDPDAEDRVLIPVPDGFRVCADPGSPEPSNTDRHESPLRSVG